jgi:outer membrane protein assembly factor BamB
LPDRTGLLFKVRANWYLRQRPIATEGTAAEENGMDAPFAIIPTVVILAPLAVLALLLAAVFRAARGALRRWSVLLGVAAADGALYLVHFAVREDWRGSWLTRPVVLWGLLTLVTSAGALWAWRGQRRAAAPERLSQVRPRRAEWVGLGALGLAGVGAVLFSRQEGYPLFHPSLVVWATAWLAVAYLLLQRWLAGRAWAARMLVPTPVAVLGALAVNCGLCGATTLCANRALVWSFPAEDKGNILAAPRVGGEHVYAGVAMNGGGGNARWGVVYCLDRATGEKRWAFTDDRRLKPVQSTPCLDQGRLYFGEGLADSGAGKFYCLDVATGEKRWDFQAGAPVTSSPCAADGRVFSGAGPDGIYCLDAASGEKRWRFEVRADGSPVALDGRLYAGGSSGGDHELLCLDAATGRPLWRTPVGLPLRSAPLCVEGRVFGALGNGTLTRSAEAPAGAVVCLEALTGRRVWRHDAPDGVFGGPAVGRGNVYFGCRDGRCYCLDIRDGNVRWARDLGSPVVTAPALSGEHLFVATSQCLVFRLRADTGEGGGHYDCAKYTRMKPWLFSSPAVADGYVWFGVGLDDLVGGMVPRLYCLNRELGLPQTDR